MQSVTAPKQHQQLVALTNDNIAQLIKENQEELRPIPDVEYELDLTKEFRFKHYPIILLILKNALKELVSTVVPSPENEWRDTKQRGFLYLYDGHVPNYMNDAIKWKKTRMSVKLIVYNKSKGIYKLKNHKADEGNAVMRRQTWQGNGWRKNEYKLINRETYYKPETDGTFSVNECQTLQDFPVLVHYFRKNDSGRDSPTETKPPTSKRKANEALNDNNFDCRRDSEPQIKEEKEPLFLTLPTSPSLLFNPGSPSNVANITKEELCMFSTDFLQPPQAKESSLFFTKFAARSAPAPIAMPTPSAEIRSFAPDTAPSGDTTKVLLFVQGFSDQPESQYSCMIDGREVPVKRIADGVLEFMTPPHTAGVVQFWLMCREPGSKSVQYSNTVFFFYTPSDETARLSLAFNNLQSDHVTRDMLGHFKHTVKELDMSNNSLTDLDFLSEFYQLHTLILDNNQIGPYSKIPALPKLVALYVNCNLVTELEPFLNTLKTSCPNLQYLSLLGNEACPCFSKQSHHYYNYRIFVISQLRKLTQLDSSPVTPEEWRHAACIIPEEDDDISATIKQEPEEPYSP